MRLHNYVKPFTFKGKYVYISIKPKCKRKYLFVSLLCCSWHGKVYSPLVAHLFNGQPAGMPSHEQGDGDNHFAVLPAGGQL